LHAERLGERVGISRIERREMVERRRGGKGE